MSLNENMRAVGALCHLSPGDSDTARIQYVCMYVCAYIYIEMSVHSPGMLNVIFKVF